jgi:hypothetical protein
MQTSLNINQIIRMQPSNSVYSAGLNQDVMLSCMKSVLVRTNFEQIMTQDTTIDSTTCVKNDQNTLQAALDAIEEIIRAFNRALANTLSLTTIAFIACISLGGILFMLSIAFQVATNRAKNNYRMLVDDHCGTKSARADEGVISNVTSAVRDAKELQAEVASLAPGTAPAGSAPRRRAVRRSKKAINS